MFDKYNHIDFAHASARNILASRPHLHRKHAAIIFCVVVLTYMVVSRDDSRKTLVNHDLDYK